MATKRPIPRPYGREVAKVRHGRSLKLRNEKSSHSRKRVRSHEWN
jgi:hypothetical protein